MLIMKMFLCCELTFNWTKKNMCTTLFYVFNNKIISKLNGLLWKPNFFLYIFPNAFNFLMVKPKTPNNYQNNSNQNKLHKTNKTTIKSKRILNNIKFNETQGR